MKCQKCGHDIPDGDLFCKNCGAEVQLVPDYNSVEYLMQYKKNMEQAEYQKKLDAELEQSHANEKKTKKKRTIWIVFAILLGLAILCVLVYFLLENRNRNSYEYQYEHALSSYQQQDYTKAQEYIDQALYLRSDSLDAELLSVDLLLSKDEKTEAIESLKAIIFNHPEEALPYEKLLGLYESDGDVTAIKELMDNCTSDAIRTQFADYICADPVITTMEGSYKYKLQVEIEQTDNTVYYTIDGSLPQTGSTQYTGPVELPEGDTFFQAIAYNAKGIPSNVVSSRYTVLLTRPDPPVIEPVSGSYKKNTKITVTVPEGCTAYYAFDKTADSSGREYTAPVTMQNGEHIFSVILIDSNGKQSYPASATYVVE